MITTAVTRLKAHLSELLAHVKAGEELLVTDRGKPIARIVPVARDAQEMPPHLKELERAGLVRIGTGKLPDDFWKMPKPKDPRGLVRKALLEEREEGR